MQINNIQKNSFTGIHVSKTFKFNHEQKQLITALKKQLLNGEVKSKYGRDLYKKYDSKGYNFFIDWCGKNNISVYLDKVKEDDFGKKKYETKHIIGNFSKTNLNEFIPKIQEINRTDNIDKLTSIAPIALVILLFSSFLFMKK